MIVAEGVSWLTEGIVVEPVQRGTECLLLLLAAEGRPFRVNGELTTHCQCLRQGDVVELFGGATLHVTLHMSTTIGPAPTEYADRRCPTCRGVIGTSIVYICPVCRVAIHCDDGPGERLNCLLGSECPACHSPVRADAASRIPGS